MVKKASFSASTNGATVNGTLTETGLAQPSNIPSPAIRAIGPRVTFNYITGEWSSGNTYQYYDVVQVEGVSYIAKQNVPTGIDISDTDYWVKWADPNAQFSELQNTVNTFDSRITQNAMAITSETERAQTAEQQNATAIASETERAQTAEQQNATAIDSIGSDGKVTLAADNISTNNNAFIAHNKDKFSVIPGTRNMVGNAANITNPIPTFSLGNQWLEFGHANNIKYGQGSGDGMFTWTFNEEAQTLTPKVVTVPDKIMDCNVFTQFILQGIVPTQSPYSGNAGMFGYYGKTFDGSVIETVPYSFFDTDMDTYNGRMYTWQFAKYLNDAGLLHNNSYPPIGALLFTGNPNVDTWNHIGHCCILLNAFPSDNGIKYSILECTDKDPNYGIIVHEYAYNELNIYGWFAFELHEQYYYKNTFVSTYGYYTTKQTISSGELTFNRDNPYDACQLLLMPEGTGNGTIHVKATSDTGNYTYIDDDFTISAYRVIPLYILKGDVSITVTGATTWTDLQILMRNSIFATQFAS